ncbi:MAG: hypothetical protein COB23_00880 [Methylophaga sp.]|nr:MAG: hypothetical protein COB23_00880 [Methylophaga sp.]
MKTVKLGIALLAATGLSTIVTPVLAYEAGDWLVRGRIINVNPDDSSGAISVGGTDVAGSGVKIDSDTVPEIDITYMISPNWGVELIAAISSHDVDATGTLSTLNNVIDAKALPPTLLLQYHFSPNSNIRPYVGAGINYTYFFDESVDDVLDIPGAKVDLDDSWGLAAQAGVDIALNNDWFVNLDVKYIDIDTTAKFKGTAVGSAKVNVDIDPIVWGIGIGRRF